jgi:ribosomal protein L11 methyltransferase
MSYIQITLLASEQDVEALSEALMEIDALSVSVEDVDEGTDAEQPLYGEPGMVIEHHAWAHSRVLVLFADDATADAALALLLANEVIRTEQLSGRETIEDQDWVRITQAQFEPIVVTEGLTIVPTWHEPTGSGIAIRLDPGIAFGTGSHPTTHLCLQWLCANPPVGAQVLDYGCGSGILAIAALKLGAARCAAVDIDPSAVEASLYNAQLNDVALEAALPGTLDANGGVPFDCVLANILSTPLKLLAPVLAARLKAGGALVLSGILERQADEMVAHYAPYARMAVWKAHDGWVCLAGTRNP